MKKHEDTQRVAAVLAAAGSSSRMGHDKLFMSFGGKSVVRRAAEAIAPFAQEKIAVCAPESLQRMARELEGTGFRVVPGGSSRALSVAAALKELEGGGIVLVHDGARPFVTPSVIQGCIETARRHGSAVAAVPCKDTVRRCIGGRAQACFKRSEMYQMQTPQCFGLEKLKRAYSHMDANALAACTDDAAVYEAAGEEIYLSPGDYANIKITTPEDAVFARALCQGSCSAEPACQAGADGGQACEYKAYCGAADAGDANTYNGENKMRIGNGFDVHALVMGRRLVLCGVEIPHETGLEGHSDADVALHALMDAMLGAAGLSDIGQCFPDNDPQYKNADSMKLLERVADMLKMRALRVCSADITVIAQAPKLSPYISDMRANIAKALQLPQDRANVKATTTEKLGFTGRKEGIAAMAAVLLSED